MMKLYYSKGACSLAVRIVLHEMNIPCKFEAVDLKTKRTETNVDFLSINPKGAVPVLITDQDEVLTENAVIQQYLADLADLYYALLPPLNTIKRYHVLEWLNFISTDLHKGCAPLFNPDVPQEIKDTVFKPALKNKLNIVEQQLQNHPFLTGDTFTLPDAYCFVILSWLPHFKINLHTWPLTARYYNDLKTRQAVQRALQEEGL